MKTIKKTFKAVILAGGSGERFWPLSTSEKPKQFLRYFGGKSLIRQSVERLQGLVEPQDIYIVTTKALVSITRRELPELPSANIVGEPMRRDTGAAIALGVGLAKDGVIGFFPSDQLVRKPAAFRKSLKAAIRRTIETDRIVTLGIRPDHPATGYGYIDPKGGKFVEKPNAALAKKYISRGYLWNAGMFIADAMTFRAAFAEHAPALGGLALGKVRGTAKLAAAYEKLPRISFDYAVMEKLPRVEVVAGDFGWDDVGGYGAFDRYYPHDGAGNVVVGECNAVESEGNICVANGAPISLLGVSNLVVVATKDAVLVADKRRVSEMKKLFAKK